MKRKVVLLLCALCICFFGRAFASTPALYYPFKDKGVTIVQGWVYNFEGGRHCGIDYYKRVKETKPDGTQEWIWKPFEVTAPMDGEYWYYGVLDGYGKVALGRHIINGAVRYTTYAHLDSTVLTPTHVTLRAGDYIGMAGHTGTSEDIIHLHFELSAGETHLQKGCEDSVDPYDIWSTVTYYPEKGGTCGPNHYWTQCSPAYPASCTETTQSYPVSLVQVTGTTVPSITTWYETADGGSLSLLGSVPTDYTTSTVDFWMSGRLNDDQFDDLVASVTINGMRSYQVFVAVGDGTFLPPVSWMDIPVQFTDLTFLGDVDADGLDDVLIADLVNNEYQWNRCYNYGYTIGYCEVWENSSSTTLGFGTASDVMLVADMDGNGKAELLRGQLQNTSECSGKLKWRRFKQNGSAETIHDCWGVPTNRFIVGDVNGDGTDELLNINVTPDSTVESYVGVFNTTTHLVTTSRWSMDVGGMTGWYGTANVNNDQYTDLVRWATDGKVVWLKNKMPNTAGFYRQSNEVLLAQNIPQGNKGQVLFGNFGTVTKTTCTTPTTTATPASVNTSATAEEIIPFVEEGDVFQGSGATVFYFSHGRKRGFVSGQIFEGCGFKSGEVVRLSDTALSRIPDGEVLDEVTDCLEERALIQGSGYTVYYYYRGHKHGFVSGEIFAACGFLSDGVIRVPDSTLNALRNGAVVDDVTDCTPMADLLWRQPYTSEVGGWVQNGTQLLRPLPNMGSHPDYDIVGTHNVNYFGDLLPGIFWRNRYNGETDYWVMREDFTIMDGRMVSTSSDLRWDIVGLGDFTGDGHVDFLWRNLTTGEMALWGLIENSIAAGYALQLSHTDWDVVAVGDLTMDGKPDIMWRHFLTGELYLWEMDGVSLRSSILISTYSDLNWTIAGIGDFTKDGHPDILWRNPVTGEMSVWQMQGTLLLGSLALSGSDPNWTIVGVGDLF